MMNFYNSFYSILNDIPTIPIIAAINGNAYGAGACLALLCDFRTGCKDTTKLGLNFTKLGIHPGMGGSYLLNNMLHNKTVVNDILLYGKVLNGNECYNYNILNKLHPTNDAQQCAYDMAIELITTTHPVAIRTTLQTVRSQNTITQQMLYHEATQQSICYSQPDWGEGLNATIQKRLPNFMDTYHPSTK